MTSKQGPVNPCARGTGFCGQHGYNCPSGGQEVKAVPKVMPVPPPPPPAGDDTLARLKERMAKIRKENAEWWARHNPECECSWGWAVAWVLDELERIADSD